MGPTTVAVTIAAPIEEVWRAITTPEVIREWFFGVDTETDWQVGSPIVHRGTYQGKPYVDKGEILAFDPPRSLVHTHWSDISGTADEPANYQEVSWALEEVGPGETQLTITERDFPSEEAQAVSERSWRAVLESLKALLER